ncbi:MAG: hypothetical protein RR769_01100, partial [Anaerovoracaceae bacterium]
ARLLPAFANITSWHGFCAQKFINVKPSPLLGTAFAPSRQTNRHLCRCVGTAFAPKSLQPTAFAPEKPRRSQITITFGMAFAPKTFDVANPQLVGMAFASTYQPKRAQNLRRRKPATVLAQLLRQKSQGVLKSPSPLAQLLP